MEPTTEDFIQSLPADVKLSEYQINLAKSYIEYRKAHFSGGLRGGRTTAISYARKYLEDQEKFGGLIFYEEPM